MGFSASVCLAEFFAIKALALVAAGAVAYLFWIGFQEKRERRREQRWLEQRRRELKDKTAPKP